MKTLSLGDTGSMKRMLPLLAGLLVLLGAWFAWGAWRQWRESGQSSQLAATRDVVANTVSSALAKQLAVAQKAAQSPAVIAAAQTGDYAAASQALMSAWPGSDHAEVAPADLQAMMAGLPASGYGRAGVAQAALANGKPAVAIARDGGQPKLLIAVPVAAGAAVAVAAQSSKSLGDVVAKADAGQGYLALKQGDATLAQAGDKGLESAGDKSSTPIKGSDWTLQAYAAPVEPGSLGFGRVMSAILAVLLVAGGIALLWLRQRLAGQEQEPVVEDEAASAPEHDEEPTVGDLTAQNQTAAAEAAATRAEAAKAAGPTLPDPGIFRAYDIRGIVGKTLSVDVARQIGQSIGTLMHEHGLHDIVVGRDGRLSGPDLVGGLTEGLRRAGRNVISIGLAPTPLVYFGAYHLRTGCCVAVTGSHNPPDYNGLKMMIGGTTLAGADIQALRQLIAADDFETGAGSISQTDVSKAYIDRIVGDVKLKRPMKIIVDCGNGVPGAFAPALYRRMGCTVRELFCEVDGNFPNHHPDPSQPENLEDLIEALRHGDEEIGLAFDGDGDRLGVVTKAGKIIFPDRQLMLFAADVLSRNPGAQVIFDVKSTRNLFSWIRDHGGMPMMWKTGHSLIKSKMKETGALLAGEMSGHVFFKERWFGFDDGLYAGARLLEFLSASADLNGEFAKLPDSVNTPELQIKLKEGENYALIDTLQKTAKFPSAKEIITIDGLRVEYADGFGLARSSNTTPVIVLRFEADNAPALQRIQDDFRRVLRAAKPDAQLPF